MYLDFMTSGVWDALVVAITVIGLALAIRQIAQNRADYRNQRHRDR